MYVLLENLHDKLNNIHEKCLRFITNGYDSNFNELLESSHKLSVYKTCINYLMIEVYKYLYELSPQLMSDIFTLWKNPYNIHNTRLFDSENPQSVRLGVDEVAFRASHLWQKVPIAMKNSSSLEIFKAK